jgi:hypothetical protein
MEKFLRKLFRPASPIRARQKQLLLDTTVTTDTSVVK